MIQINAAARLPPKKPGQKLKWTKDDARLCAKIGVALVGSAAVLGWLLGGGLFWGAVGGAGLWSLIVVAALALAGDAVGRSSSRAGDGFTRAT
jgi:hypothetical protein